MWFTIICHYLATTWHLYTQLLSIHTPLSPLYHALALTVGPGNCTSNFDVDEVYITYFTGSCQNENFQCSQRRQFHQHDDVTKWKHFTHYWPFVRGIHRLPVNSPHKGQWRGALGFSLIWAWVNRWVHNCEAGDLRRHRAHYDVIVMSVTIFLSKSQSLATAMFVTASPSPILPPLQSDLCLISC